MQGQVQLGKGNTIQYRLLARLRKLRSQLTQTQLGTVTQ